MSCKLSTPSSIIYDSRPSDQHAALTEVFFDKYCVDRFHNHSSSCDYHTSPIPPGLGISQYHHRGLISAPTWANSSRSKCKKMAADSEGHARMLNIVIKMSCFPKTWYNGRNKNMFPEGCNPPTGPFIQSKGLCQGDTLIATISLSVHHIFVTWINTLHTFPICFIHSLTLMGSITIFILQKREQVCSLQWLA